MFSPISCTRLIVRILLIILIVTVWIKYFTRSPWPVCNKWGLVRDNVQWDNDHSDNDQSDHDQSDCSQRDHSKLDNGRLNGHLDHDHLVGGRLHKTVGKEVGLLPSIALLHSYMIIVGKYRTRPPAGEEVQH